MAPTYCRAPWLGQMRFTPGKVLHWAVSENLAVADYVTARALER